MKNISIIFILFLLIYSASESNADDFISDFFEPLPEKIDLPPKKVELGKKLFFDKRLSSNNTLSCASCHEIDKGGIIPNQQKSLPGVNGKTVNINIPTVFNSGFNHTQFWDGRAASLEEQIDGPTHNPDEMGSNWVEIISKLENDADYKNYFSEIYNSPPTAEHIKDAIATFERSLITPNSPFDKYLKGDKSALSEKAIKGYDIFINYGCVSCHQGINLGGNMFQTMGIIDDYFANRGNVTNIDLGRYNITGREEDKFVFRVPTLRNVELTAPYFHDGSAKDLEQAIDTMAKYQLGYELTKDEKEALVEFLKSLTGKYKGSKD